MTHTRPWILVAALAACATKKPPAGPPENLLDSAYRKIKEGDGVGCLADLDRLAVQRPTASLEDIRAQCEMLSGACQAGKQRLTEKLQVYADNAKLMLDQHVMRFCRGGDATERDRLLRALYRLRNDVGDENLTAAECSATLIEVGALLPKVPPEADDSFIAVAARLMYDEAANCFARAGDCAAAWKVYIELMPKAAIQGASAEEIAETVGAKFDEGVPQCKGTR